MKFKRLNAKDQNINTSKYVINWKDDSLSKIQYRIKSFLYPYWRGHVVFEELRLAGTRLRLDFLNITRNIAVEVDGKQHTDPKNYFNGGNKFTWLAQVERDLEKDRWCELNGFKLVRINESEVDSITSEWFLEKYDIAL